MPKIPVTMAPVTSSQIAAIGHDAENNHLYVQFHPSKKEQEAGKAGSVYRYDNFEASHHAALLGHDEKCQTREGHSIGSHFIHNVKRKPEDHPYLRVNQDEE